MRFTTSHPNDFTREIVEAIDAIPALCDHFHLPVQSGSTRILRAMRRTYTREEYLEKISWIRAARRPISITTDIIVGFPGETEADFDDTLTLLDAVGYDGVFAFKYSPRPNTSAAAHARRRSRGREDQAPRDSCRNASARSRRRATKSSSVETFEVLVDARHAARDQWAGRTTSNRV